MEAEGDMSMANGTFTRGRGGGGVARRTGGLDYMFVESTFNRRVGQCLRGEGEGRGRGGMKV